MKVLVFSTNGVIRDGITSWLLQYFTLMDRSDLAIHTIAFEDAPSDLLTRLDEAKIVVHTLPSRKRHPLRYARALHGLVKGEVYDAVHINGNSGTTAIDLLCCIGTATKIRIVHSRNTRGEFPKLDKAVRPIMNRLTTDRFACGTDAGRWLFGDSDFTIIPNGKEFTGYSYDQQARGRARDSLGLTSSEVAIGHVGNFNEQKNHRFLIDAFSKAMSLNPGLRLFLIGDGPLRPEIEERAKDHGIAQHVYFLGRIGDVTPYLNALDAAVLPSLYEGFPNVVIEWQINGLPAFISSSVTKECAVTNLVKVLPAGDEDAWAQAMANTAPVDRQQTSRFAQYSLRAAGYEAHEAAERLRTLYFGIGASASNLRR